MSAPRPGGQLACATAGLALVILHTTAVNVALPSIGDGLGGDVAALQWVASAYALALATLLLPCGAAADRFGARRVLRVGLAVFGLASLASAAAPGLTLLVVAQAAAGAGAAMIVPTSLSLVRAAYPDARERARALGTLSLGLAVGFGAGPIVGGALVVGFGWRAVFLVDVACALALAVLAGRLVASEHRQPRRLPAPAGVVLAVLAVGGVAFTLTEGASRGWRTTPVLVAAVVGGLAAAGLAASQRRSAAPLVPRTLVASPDVVLAALVGLLFNAAVYGELFVLSLDLQEVRGATPLEAGLLFLPQPIGTLLVAAAAGRWLGDAGWRRPLLAGLGLSTAGAALLVGFDQGPFPLTVLVALGLAGVAGGLVVPAIHTMVAAGAPSDVLGLAGAALNAGRQLGGVLGVALLGAFVAGGDLAGGARMAFAAAVVTQLAALALVWRRRAAPAVEARRPALVLEGRVGTCA